MKIALGSDHAGFAYKTAIASALRAQGHELGGLPRLHSPGR